MQHATTPGRRAALLALVLLAACDQSARDRHPLSPRSSARLQAVEDSVAFLARRGTGAVVTTQATGGVEVHAGDQVAITVTSAECASVGTVLAVSGPVSRVISSNACFSTGTSVSLGPASADGFLTFVMNDPRFGSGSFTASGTYPSYTVNMEDGYGDGDFNDAVLSVTMTPAAPLTCTPNPERGSTVRCEVATSLPVQGWEFRGGGTTVTGRGGTQFWEGPAVVGGTVKAKVLRNGREETLSASFTVRARQWEWSRRDFSYQEGAAPIVSGGDIAPAVEVTFLAGWNCTLPDCMRKWVVPDLSRGETGGYAVARASSGPNEGFWYLSASNFTILRGSNFNPEMQPGAPTRFALTAQEAAACPSVPVGASGSGEANWYTFNVACKSIPVPAILEAVRLHEGYGSSGTNGHQSQGELAAVEDRSNLPKLIEGLYQRDEAALRQRVLRTYNSAESRIARAGGQEPTSNYPRTTVWLWSYNRNRFQAKSFGPL